MRPKPSTHKSPSVQIVKRIHRATRNHYSAEDKIRIVLDGLLGEMVTRRFIVCSIRMRPRCGPTNMGSMAFPENNDTAIHGVIEAANKNHGLARRRRLMPPAEDPAELPFIFVIGFNKTATTSLHTFFSKNGFPSVHWDRGRLARRMVENCLEDRPILDGYDREFRVFSDMQAQSGRIRIEANQYFRVLDRDYPGAYFIFNNRDLGGWINSRSANFVTPHGATNLELEMRRLNTTDQQEAVRLWVRERNVFEAEVRRYFRGNPRFLEIDIANPDLPRRISRHIGRTMDPAHWKRIRTN